MFIVSYIPMFRNLWDKNLNLKSPFDSTIQLSYNKPSTTNKGILSYWSCHIFLKPSYSIDPLQFIRQTDFAFNSTVGSLCCTVGHRQIVRFCPGGGAKNSVGEASDRWVMRSAAKQAAAGWP
jgi:hypothetical protein